MHPSELQARYNLPWSEAVRQAGRMPDPPIRVPIDPPLPKKFAPVKHPTIEELMKEFAAQQAKNPRPARPKITDDEKELEPIPDISTIRPRLTSKQVVFPSASAISEEGKRFADELDNWVIPERQSEVLKQRPSLLRKLIQRARRILARSR